MWMSRSRERDDEARYIARTAGRLQVMVASYGLTGETEPAEIRARLDRMRHGAARVQRAGVGA